MFDVKQRYEKDFNEATFGLNSPTCFPFLRFPDCRHVPANEKYLTSSKESNKKSCGTFLKFSSITFHPTHFIGPVLLYWNWVINSLVNVSHPILLNILQAGLRPGSISGEDYFGTIYHPKT